MGRKPLGCKKGKGATEADAVNRLHVLASAGMPPAGGDGHPVDGTLHFSAHGHRFIAAVVFSHPTFYICPHALNKVKLAVEGGQENTRAPVLLEHLKHARLFCPKVRQKGNFSEEAARGVRPIEVTQPGHFFTALALVLQFVALGISRSFTALNKNTAGTLLLSGLRVIVRALRFLHARLLRQGTHVRGVSEQSFVRVFFPHFLPVKAV
jgi:hypothetical protein